MRALFLCSRNRWRSPTAQHIFADTPGWETDSAGLSPDAEHALSADQVEWAEVIFVMEKKHRARLRCGFSRILRNKRVVVLNIPDDFTYGQPELVDLLRSRMATYV